jgi:hypothetical protein
VSGADAGGVDGAVDWAVDWATTAEVLLRTAARTTDSAWSSRLIGSSIRWGAASVRRRPV